jgi:hypothetical protein
MLRNISLRDDFRKILRISFGTENQKKYSILSAQISKGQKSKGNRLLAITNDRPTRDKLAASGLDQKGFVLVTSVILIPVFVLALGTVSNFILWLRKANLQQHQCREIVLDQQNTYAKHYKKLFEVNPLILAKRTELKVLKTAQIAAASAGQIELVALISKKIAIVKRQMIVLSERQQFVLNNLKSQSTKFAIKTKNKNNIYKLNAPLRLPLKQDRSSLALNNIDPPIYEPIDNFEKEQQVQVFWRMDYLNVKKEHSCSATLKPIKQIPSILKTWSLEKVLNPDQFLLSS